MKQITRIVLPVVAVFLITATAFAQTVTTVTGNVKNSKTKESVAAVSVMIKGATSGAYTDEKGNFKFTTTQSPPFTLIISSVGFEAKEVAYNTSGAAVNVELNVSYALGQEIVVAASRTPQRILESPVSIERVSAANIRNAPGASYYDALANLKGVDITTSSYTFKTPSTRGFNGSGSLRFNQLVDGMDNTLPALNFSVGNVIGLTELDVDNMELLPGASSALYGSGGMNGTLLINSKNPFKYQGVSFQVKQGIMHIGDDRQKASPFYDWSLRWGKKVSDKFAFKFGAQYVKADDWQADDKTNLLRNNVLSSTKPGDRGSDPNYDGVNVLGDEVSADMWSFSQAASSQIPASGRGLLDQLIGAGYSYQQIQAVLAGNEQTQPLLPALPFYMGYKKNIYAGQSISRTGYDERDVVDYNTFNFKISGGLYYNITDNIEASLTGNYGSGTSVYTGADRYSLKNFQIGQYKLEFKSKNWFLRAYTTQENSGDSYASTLTAIAVNDTWKSNSTWLQQYVGTYSDQFLQGKGDAASHGAARAVSETGRFLPGSTEYNAAFNKSITTPISNGGSQFADKSDLYQFEGQLNLSQYIKVVDVLVGVSYRQYNINSKGTIFADTDSAGAIKIGETGTYIQLQKALFKDVLKLTASGRYDKNENFDGRFTPRVAATLKVAKDNNIRVSFQQAYRFPTNQDQWINLKSPGSILIGGLQNFADYYKFSTSPVYSAESVVAYRASVNTGAPNPTLLKQTAFTTVKPERMNSFEVGYKGIIAKRLLIDLYYYTSKYQDFIARVAVARGQSGSPDPLVNYTELASPFTTTNYSFVTNSPTPVKANGFGIGGDYQVGDKGYRIMANFYTDALKDVPNGLITFFNTPKSRYNVGFANANAYKGLGFNVIYKWQDKVNWQGTFAASEIPAFGTLDMQVSYKPGKTKNLIKFGATNVFNNYYRNAFGNPYIGGLYYISFGYNVF